MRKKMPFSNIKSLTTSTHQSCNKEIPTEAIKERTASTQQPLQ